MSDFAMQAPGPGAICTLFGIHIPAWEWSAMRSLMGEDCTTLLFGHRGRVTTIRPPDRRESEDRNGWIVSVGDARWWVRIKMASGWTIDFHVGRYHYNGFALTLFRPTEGPVVGDRAFHDHNIDPDRAMAVIRSYLGEA